MILYTLTLFVAAFLLFLVQPLVAKQILPWFGGGPSVWTACMLFFQVFLLGGYAYARWADYRLDARRQAWGHIGLVAVSLAFASIAPGPEWRPSGSESPTLRILLLLAANVGVPFLVLASTSPMLTRWYSLLWPSRPPYRLYALSNAGSLLALLAYPLAFDPLVAVEMQSQLWSLGYIVFVLLSLGSAAIFLRRAPAAIRAGSSESAAVTIAAGPDAGGAVSWIAMAAVGSSLLLSTTSQITHDVAVVPLLWVLPLAIYLISFILCFEHDRWYRRAFFLPLLALSSLAVTVALVLGKGGWTQIALPLVALFAGTMVCHGELARSRPSAERLTRFYLAIAAGGALGGFFVSVVAPYIFSGYWEYGLSLIAVGVVVLARVRPDAARASSPKTSRLAWVGGSIVLAAVAVGIGWREFRAEAGALESERTFFGVLRVVEHETPSGPARMLMHGRIAHGSQFTVPERRGLPTTYFGRDSGIGIALERYRALGRVRGTGLRMAVLGMGVGTLSVYAGEGEFVRFYEIDPAVDRLAREHFSYLEDSAADIDVVLGDARLMLERGQTAGSGDYDVLVVDVFSGDAVPVHLLTRQAYQLYLSQLRPGGLIAINVSNRYLDLAAVVRGLAEEAGQRSVRIVSTADPWLDTQSAWWVLASSDAELIDDPSIRLAATPWSEHDPQPIVWTDETASLIHVMTRGLVANKWESAPNLGHFVVDRAGLLSPADAVRIRTSTRALYSETGGSVPLAVVTTAEMPTEARSPDMFEDFTGQLFEKLGMSDEERELGMLIFVSMADRRAAIHVGRSWPLESREYINRIFVRVALEGLSDGRPSAGLADAAEALSEFVREQAS